MQPILALDVGSLFAVAFLLISFIGWIMNLINSQNPPPQPNRPARRPQQRDGKVQSEIEEFLQQAMNRRGPRQAKPQADGIEIIEPAPTRRKPPARPVARPTDSTETARPAEVLPSTRPGEGIASRPSVGTATLGAGVASHVQEHMKSRVGQDPDRHLPHNVEESIALHLGQFRAGQKDTRQDVAPAFRSRAAIKDVSGFLAELRRPEGMRKAVILNEILNKPRVLRRT